MAFVASAVIGGIGSLAGAKMQSDAMKSAASTQADAARDANMTQLSMYNQTRSDQQPWREAGMSALSKMQDPSFNQTFNWMDPGTDNVKDPGYNFRLQEGMKAINNAAAARGMGNSGATMKALAKYNQDFASNEYSNAYNRFNNDQNTRFNRLSSLAGVGQTANNQVQNAGMNYANQYGQNATGAANAMAAGQVGSANAYNNAIGQGMNSWMNYQMMNKMFPSKSPSLGGGGSNSPLYSSNNDVRGNPFFDVTG